LNLDGREPKRTGHSPHAWAYAICGGNKGSSGDASESVSWAEELAWGKSRCWRNCFANGAVRSETQRAKGTHLFLWAAKPKGRSQRGRIYFFGAKPKGTHLFLWAKPKGTYFSGAPPAHLHRILAGEVLRVEAKPREACERASVLTGGILLSCMNWRPSTLPASRWIPSPAKP
jgi:hypothetical protein